MQPYPINPRTCIVRNTGRAHGRTRTVAPGITAARFLHFGRIVLEGPMRRCESTLSCSRPA